MEAIQTLNPADVWEVVQKVIVWLAGIGIVIDLTPGIKVQPVRWLIKQLGNLMNHDMREQLTLQTTRLTAGVWKFWNFRAVA